MGEIRFNDGIRPLLRVRNRNGGSVPPRLPSLSKSLGSLAKEATPDDDISIVAVSYRGFWTSKGRPSQRGLEQDAASAIDWVVRELSPSPPHDLHLVLWGQSIGAGVVTAVTANLMTRASLSSKIKALLLETPFTSLKDVLAALYPQSWLPYRYLWPFLTSQWDSVRALKRIAKGQITRKPIVLIVQAGQDEIVPDSHGKQLLELCLDLGFDAKLKSVPNALHTNAMSQSCARKFVSSELCRVLQQRRQA